MTTKKTRHAIGSAILKARKAAGMTQVQVARAARLSQTHVSRLESGEKAPSVGALRALARVLSLDVDALLES